ncbi:pirin family protein [Hymenobacter taeanensis]|uniref:Pirin family protein n=1 Tax=Hymenobacter taeanensis TaxID=2735321 RepID=A0A6M6BCK5_9BACT|nr:MULTISPECIES: pirin family protein [Hymenobacter]QJX45538.1 pirin family protein [Hymenobacter taeanensis]UOQ81214.1 pirin family protein [Hymenobacter sp. 5414T-23]
MTTTGRRIFQIIDGNKKFVGDGFDVTSPMPGPRIRQLSPYLLIDHTGPMAVAPTNSPLGTPPHPHRGFETVTVVYEGYLAHRDTAGHTGALGPSDVQWMTAGAGLLHEERHEKEFAKRGGTLELLQLWVNVPKKDKLAPPRYQNIEGTSIPAIATPDGLGQIRVIAGTYEGTTGPAETFSPITLLDVHLQQGNQTTLHLPADYNVGIYVVKGDILLHSDRAATTKQLVVFGWDAPDIHLTATTDAVLLVLAGAPIEEPLATYGPFVMNTNQELVQAITDFESGGMGTFPEDE